jgi:hypothetical protein
VYDINVLVNGQHVSGGPFISGFVVIFRENDWTKTTQNRLCKMSGFFTRTNRGLFHLFILTIHFITIKCRGYHDGGFNGQTTLYHNNYNARSVFGTQLAKVTIGSGSGWTLQKINNDSVLIFGGNGFAANSTRGYLNDVWRYQMSTNRWTWLTGSKTIDTPSSYDTAPFFPGSRSYHISWLTSNGDMYTSTGLVNSGPGLNDLWRYRLSTNEWSFIGGQKGENGAGQFGAKGNSSVDYLPPSRGASVSWIDQNGDFWLFGGGLVYRNDLWRYRPSTLEWTWISGSNITKQLGVYGNQGNGSANNVPGARYFSSSWTDSQGNFWLFGGLGYGNSVAQLGNLNDLWRYTPSNNEWTWMKGSFLRDQPSNFGTRNVSSPNNVPASRYSAVSAVDPNGDDLWLFSGAGSTGGFTNHLWRYRISTNEWTWMSGGQPLNYGTQGVPSTTNYPGARNGGVMWCDSIGDLWLMGGIGNDEVPIGPGILNDIWRYRPSTNEWTWIGGSKTRDAFAVFDQCQGVDDGVVCDNSDACTLNDTCQSGVCVSGSPIMCNASSICFLSTCDTLLGCVESPNPSTQNDPQCLPPGAPNASPNSPGVSSPISAPSSTSPAASPKSRVSSSHFLSAINSVVLAFLAVAIMA